MRIHLKNHHLVPLVPFLQGMNLKGERSRARSKFLTLALEAYTALHESELDLHSYSTFINSLMSGDYVILDVNNRDETAGRFGYETLIERGVSVTVRAKVTDVNRKAIGYVGVDFREPPSPDMVDEAVREVQEMAAELGALLSVNKRKDKG